VLLGELDGDISGAREPEQLVVRDALPQGVHLVDVEPLLLGDRLPGDEEDRRHAEPLEHRNRELELAAEPVVEGDDAGALGQRGFSGDRCEQVVPRHELERAADQLELGGEPGGRHGKDRPRLGRRLGRDIVVADREEDHPAMIGLAS